MWGSNIHYARLGCQLSEGCQPTPVPNAWGRGALGTCRKLRAGTALPSVHSGAFPDTKAVWKKIQPLSI